MTDKKHKRNAASVRAGHDIKLQYLNKDRGDFYENDSEWKIQLSKRNKRLAKSKGKHITNDLVGKIITSGQKTITFEQYSPITSTKQNTTTKHSAGIACMRKHPQTGQLEVLLIKRRYTYAYAEFMRGSYYPADFRKGSIGENRLINLFSEMTVEDKILILSMNFSSMWYHIWLSKNKSRQYYMVKSRFEAAFKSDDGKRLKEMIISAGNGKHIWDIPKGRLNYENEGDIRCAVREFEEETGIDKSNYVIYPDIKRRHSYVDKGVRYDFIYFLAFTVYNGDNLGILGREQLSEVGDIKWMPIDMIRAVDEKKRLENILLPLMKVMRKKLRNRN